MSMLIGRLVTRLISASTFSGGSERQATLTPSPAMPLVTTTPNRRAKANGSGDAVSASVAGSGGLTSAAMPKMLRGFAQIG